MRSQAIYPLLFVFTGLVQSCDNKESIAEEAFRAHVTQESNSTLSVDTFEKTNGRESVVLGTPVYVLEWTSIISTNRSLFKISPNKFNPFYWGNFRTSIERPEQLLGTFRLPYITLGNGAKIKLAGTMTLQKTENGWKPLAPKVETESVVSGLLQNPE
jgi:hypothetical protein